MRRLTLRLARSTVAVITFLAGYLALLLVVFHYYLLPAIIAAHAADPSRRKILAAHALLILSMLLFVLLMGLLLTLRIGRFFRPRPPMRLTPTQYTDAWAEAGRRLKLPEKEE